MLSLSKLMIPKTSQIINGIPREKEKNKKINETIKCMKEKKEKDKTEEKSCKMRFGWTITMKFWNPIIFTATKN